MGIQYKGCLHQFLLLLVVLFALIIKTAYSANLHSILAVIQNSFTIDNLSDLLAALETNDTKLLLPEDSILYNQLSESENVLLRRIGARVVNSSNYNEIYEIIKTSQTYTYVTLTFRDELEVLQIQNNDAFYMPPLSLDSTISTDLVVFVVKKNSGLKQILDEL